MVARLDNNQVRGYEQRGGQKPSPTANPPTVKRLLLDMHLAGYPTEEDLRALGLHLEVLSRATKNIENEIKAYLGIAICIPPKPDGVDGFIWGEVTIHLKEALEKATGEDFETSLHYTFYIERARHDVSLLTSSVQYESQWEKISSIITLFSAQLKIYRRVKMLYFYFCSAKDAAANGNVETAKGKIGDARETYSSLDDRQELICRSMLKSLVNQDKKLNALNLL